MNSFSSILTDTVDVLKQDGTNFEATKASVQKNKIFIFTSDFIIESGDLIRRKMSNGAEETYKVIDPGFHERFHTIEAHYQMDVRKLGLPEAEKAVQSITYNVSGPNARINQNSVDNSVNIASVDPQVAEHLVAMRAEVERLVNGNKGKEEAHDLLNAIEGQFESGKPSKTVVSTLLSSLPAVGSLAALGSFVLSCIP